MKDNDLRGIVLQKYYDRRREPKFEWKLEDFADVKEDINAEDLFRVCDQLSEHGLIDWTRLPDDQNKTIGGFGTISAFGVDVIENDEKPPISINFDYSHNVSVASSSNVQIGNNNIQGISVHIQHIADAINDSSATSHEKEDAKGALKTFLEHPAVTSILGGLASTVRF